MRKFILNRPRSFFNNFRYIRNTNHLSPTSIRCKILQFIPTKTEEKEVIALNSFYKQLIALSTNHVQR